MFTKNLTPSMFKLISPIKSPPTMLSGAVTLLNSSNGTNSPKVAKLRKNNPITANMASKRFFNSNRNTLINASKTCNQFFSNNKFIILFNY